MLVVGAAALAAVAVALVVLGAEGRLAAAAFGPFDPGAFVRFGLPSFRALHNLAAAITVGALALAVWAAGPERGAGAGPLTGPRAALIRVAAQAAVCWLVLGFAVLVLTASEVSGVPPGAAGFTPVVLSFLGQVDLGRALGASLLLVGFVVAMVRTVTGLGGLAWTAVFAVVALLPLALAGHAASAGDHMNAVDSLAFHLVGVCLWVGGLVSLLLTRRALGEQLPRVVGRYSTLAAWCFVIVAGSGVVNAMLRLGSLRSILTGYGLLVLAKTAALLLLGAAGWAHRKMTVPRLADRPGRFARLASVEALVMAVTLGIAVALSRSVPPPAETAVMPLEVLLGHPAPPPLTLSNYLTAFYPSTLWLVVAVGFATLYLVGFARLRRRGDAWPVVRLVFWLVGCGVLVFVTSGGAGVYGMLHFSTHMIQHMTLMVLAPLLWVLGAPVTLALRALKPRKDGTFGPRELLLGLVHSRPLQFLGHPVMASALFTIGLIAFYYTRLFELAMFTHTGHVLMTAHFLGVGYLFVWSLVGVDPGPARPDYPFRLVVLLVTLGFHAFFGISLMSSGALLAPDWWHALGQTNDAVLLADQQVGGAIAWGSGDVPSLLIGIALIVGWVRSDTRRARQIDRQADRDGDAELRAYNERLAELNRGSGRHE